MVSRKRVEISGKSGLGCGEVPERAFLLRILRVRRDGRERKEKLAAKKCENIE